MLFRSETPGVQSALFTDENTLISIHADFKTRVWRKNQPGVTSMPPALVRTHMESLHEDWAYDLEYEGKAHESTPLKTDALLYEPKSHRLVSRGQDQIIVWDATDLVPLKKFGPRCDKYRDYRNTATAGAIAITNDGKNVAASDDDGLIYLYELETGAEVGVFHEKVIVPIPQILGLPDATTIPATPTLPVNPNQAVIPPLPSISSQVASSSGAKMCWSIGFEPDGNFFYSTHRDGYIRKWNLAKKEMVEKTMVGNIGANVAVSPSGKMLASLVTPSDHGLMSFFQIDESFMDQSFEERVTVHSHNSTGKFSKDGKSFYHALADGRLQEWKITESGGVMPGKELLRLPGQIMDFQIAEDQEMIVIASISDKMPLSVWNLKSGRLLWQAPSGHVPVWRLQLMPDDRIATLGVDNILRTYIGRKKAE
mgnify:CR=1 FL=1